MKNKEDYLNLLRKINKRLQVSQRDLAKEIGFSTGKLNHCLKSIIDKGLVKIQSFRKNPNKFNYLYVITPKGIAEKTKLTINFMKLKMEEYDQLKKELKK